MTLPEIPDEAVRAANAVPFEPTLERALAAAWPHLYAAALRHAAERGGVDPCNGDCARCATWETRLFRLAEEAKPHISAERISPEVAEGIRRIVDAPVGSVDVPVRYESDDEVATP